MKAAIKGASLLVTWLFYADLGSAQGPGEHRAPNEAMRKTIALISYYITFGYRSESL